MVFIEIVSSGSTPYGRIESHVDNIGIDSLPLRLSCGNRHSNFEEFLPTNVKDEMTSPYKWHLCFGVTDYWQCRSQIMSNSIPTNMTIDNFFEYYLHLNGN